MAPEEMGWELVVAGDGQRGKPWMMRIVLALIFLFLLGVAVYAATADPSNWSVSDWANLLISLTLSLWLFLLTEHLNRGAKERAEAVATVGLINSMGALAMSSARSLAGSDSSALRVAADARAALQHYPYAELGAKKDLVRAAIDAYIDLAFSTFSRSDRLARSVWIRLCEGTASVVAEANRQAFSKRGAKTDDDLADLADHVGFVELLGRALRDGSGPELSTGESRVLSGVWKASRLPYSHRPREERARSEETEFRLQRFRALYKHELTVFHDWSVLLDHPEDLECEVELADVASTGDWLAPWYVGTSDAGKPVPVNVLGGELDERARHDALRVAACTPHWPSALQHGRLPDGMRTSGIDNLCDLLRTQETPMVCVLAYEMATLDSNGVRKRLVLDGNHRLAAARRLSLGHAPNGLDEGVFRRFRVLTFLIRERRPVDAVVERDEDRKDSYSWKGFTPDIGLIRGTWLPQDPPT